MKQFLLLFLSLFTASFVFAQSQEYFQQEVNYKIEVSLDDNAHQLEGKIEMEYINRSPDALREIYLHLWPNAYQDNTTAFAKQQLRYQQTDFYFAPDSLRGGLYNLDFKVDGRKVVIKNWKDNPDVVILQLQEPLQAQAKIIISTPFTLKIPLSFSRLGHIGTSYQLTQWYPKPAVYDQNGWHPMPYLDAGEFYSEFGSFDVSISLPENYVVAATGSLQSPNEAIFLSNKAAQTELYLKGEASEYDQFPDNDFPKSSDQLKTIRYTAQKVHDFAWFADKRFRVQKGEAELKSGQKVATWAFYTKDQESLWKNSLNYLNRSLEFYSDLVGDYPYPQMTAVQSALSAGAGMEYPMITVIGYESSAESLDIVITHEVGHNWFYGILASNERDHAWMDEGINSYYENRYRKKYYGAFATYLIPEPLKGKSLYSDVELLHHFQKARAHQQEVNTSSNDLSSVNYWHNAYDKPAFLLKHLEAYLGEDNFDVAMQDYFQTWQFKHPQPLDFKASLEKSTQKDLSWLFEGFLFSKQKQDYGIQSLKKAGDDLELILSNKGSIAAPFPLVRQNAELQADTTWIEGFTGEYKLKIPNQNYKVFFIDPGQITLDDKRRNNQYFASKLLKKYEPLQLSLLPKVKNATRTQLGVTPVVAWNNYDKVMPGALLYNIGFARKPLEFALAPLYSSTNQDLVGTGFIRWNQLIEKGPFQLLSLNLAARRFHRLERREFDYQLAYNRINPSLKLDFRTSPASQRSNSLVLAANYVNNEGARFSDDGVFSGTSTNSIRFHQLKYLSKSSAILNPYHWETQLVHSSFNNPFDRENYLQITSAYASSFHYRSDKKINFRIFGGALLSASKDPGINILPQAFDMSVAGWNDFGFDHLFFGRGDRYGLLTRQVVIGEGGFKNALGPGQRVGRSNDYMFAVNLMADLPFDLPGKLPLRPYLDMAFLDTGGNNDPNLSQDDPFLLSAGLALDIWHNRIALYLPLVNTQNIEDSYGEDRNFFSRITFTLNLSGANLEDAVDRSF